jgi:hypothetical protein
MNRRAKGPRLGINAFAGEQHRGTSAADHRALGSQRSAAPQIQAREGEAVEEEEMRGPSEPGPCRFSASFCGSQAHQFHRGRLVSLN